VLAEIYTIIEDGVDGDVVNTKKYASLFQKALMEFSKTIPADGETLQLFGPLD